MYIFLGIRMTSDKISAPRIWKETFIHLPPGFNGLDTLSVRNVNSSLLLSQNSFAAVWEMKEEGDNTDHLDKLEGRTISRVFKCISIFLVVAVGLQADYGSH